MEKYDLIKKKKKKNVYKWTKHGFTTMNPSQKASP